MQAAGSIKAKLHSKAEVAALVQELQDVKQQNLELRQKLEDTEACPAAHPGQSPPELQAPKPAGRSTTESTQSSSLPSSPASSPPPSHAASPATSRPHTPSRSHRAASDPARLLFINLPDAQTMWPSNGPDEADRQLDDWTEGQERLFELSSKLRHEAAERERCDARISQLETEAAQRANAQQAWEDNLRDETARREICESHISQLESKAAQRANAQLAAEERLQVEAAERAACESHISQLEFQAAQARAQHAEATAASQAGLRQARLDAHASQEWCRELQKQLAALAWLRAQISTVQRMVLRRTWSWHLSHPYKLA